MVSGSIPDRCYVDDPAAFKWEADGWTPPPFDSYIIYEMHVGSFTPVGTFEAAMDKLDHLAEAGFTCVQVRTAPHLAPACHLLQFCFSPCTLL